MPEKELVLWVLWVAFDLEVHCCPAVDFSDSAKRINPRENGNYHSCYGDPIAECHDREPIGWGRSMSARYQTMPALADDDRDALERSIRTYGIQVPIIVDENGDVIDGHHRKAIALYLGIECPTIHEIGKTEAEKVALSISLNVDRRQLTREQKKELIARSLKAQPELSDRQHGERTGAAHTTVGRVRDELESTGALHQSETRVSADGRERPASRPVVNIKTKETHSTETTEAFDQSTGEAIPAEAPESPTAAILNSDDMQDRSYVRAFIKALKPAHDIAQFDADRIADLASADVARQLELAAGAITRFNEAVARRRGALRPIAGGKAK